MEPFAWVVVGIPIVTQSGLLMALVRLHQRIDRPSRSNEWAVARINGLEGHIESKRSRA